MSTSISISIFARIWAIRLVDRVLVDIERYVFANSLIGTTMQDSDKRERSG